MSYTVLGCKITNPAMCDAIAKQMRGHHRQDLAAEEKAPRREQDDSAAWLNWKREMERGDGTFVACEIMPNWLNKKVPRWLAGMIVKMQRRTAYEAAAIWREANPDAKPPFAVTLTRYGPNRMDDDGNAAAMKRQRDGVARALGIDDGEEERIRFRTAYEPAKFYGYRVEIDGQS